MDSQIDHDTTIFADEYSVSQIVINLIDNAFKYTRTGSIIIALYKKDQSVIISVEDTGVGISEKYLINLFQPFSQEYSGYTRPFDGTGLGLALVRAIVDRHDGQVSLRSREQQGTVVTLRLPVRTSLNP